MGGIAAAYPSYFHKLQRSHSSSSLEHYFDNLGLKYVSSLFKGLRKLALRALCWLTGEIPSLSSGSSGGVSALMGCELVLFANEILAIVVSLVDSIYHLSDGSLIISRRRTWMEWTIEALKKCEILDDHKLVAHIE